MGDGGGVPSRAAVIAGLVLASGAGLSPLGWAIAEPGVRAQGAAASGEQAPAPPRAFLEVDVSKRTAFVGEVVLVRLRFGFEREFLAHGAVQPFQRPLDVPLQLHVAWLDGTACAKPAGGRGHTVGSGARTATFALGDGVSDARIAPPELRGGATYEVFELERSFVLTCAGPLTLEAPALRFARTSRFRTDTFGERTPQDRVDETLVGSALELAVLPLPEVGRPADFSGAVGRFEARAELPPPTADGEPSLKLQLTITGDGDLTRFAAPRFPRADGLRAQGWVDELRNEARVITYDLVPLADGALAIPAVELPYFDPTPPGAYRTARTEPIQAAGRIGQVTSPPAPQTSDPPGRSWWRVLAALPLLALALFVARLLWRRRSRAGERHDLDEQAARRAAQAVCERAERSSIDLSEALTEYLAGRLACPAPAVIGPGLAARLERAGIPSEGAAAVARLLDELVAARYGGGAPAHSAERTRAAVEALELEFRRGARGT